MIQIFEPSSDRLTPCLRLVTLRFNSRDEMSPHQPFPRDCPLTLYPHFHIQQIGSLLPRLDVEQSVQAFDDDDTVVRLDCEGSGLRVLESVIEGTEGDRREERRLAKSSDEGHIGRSVEGEGGTTTTTCLERVLCGRSGQIGQRVAEIPVQATHGELVQLGQRVMPSVQAHRDGNVLVLICRSSRFCHQLFQINLGGFRHS